jgi:cell division protein FtsB
MPHFDNATLEVIVYAAAAVLLLFAGYRLGRMLGALRASREIARKEEELFTAQKGFKGLYEQELAGLKQQNAQLQEQVKTLNIKVDEYRKKAAGFGGLFSSGNKHADAMYALLLENEALEEALYAQNEKLRQERTDAVKEQLRSTGYRRVLMSQLLNDERIKGYVAEIMAENSSKHLPPPENADGKPAPTAAAAQTEP